jgi:hypothetical protein
MPWSDLPMTLAAGVVLHLPVWRALYNRIAATLRAADTH